jgi:Ni/Fe-hydrogenase subunit HybB-like protein
MIRCFTLFNTLGAKLADNVHDSIPSHALRDMTALSFLLPLVVHYVVALLPLAVGLLAFVRTRPGRRRHRWIAVAGLLAVLGGILVMLQSKAALLGAADDATWLIALAGLLPIALGGVSLVRWSRL